MPRGGPRQGSPGKSYNNRSDLQTGPRALPVTVGPSQQYGQAQALSQLQKAVPTANAPLPTPPPLASAPGAASAPTDPAGAASPPAPQGPLPGELGDFGGPSNNPGEHVMTGVPSGPGPGPEVLPQGGQTAPLQYQQARDRIGALAQANPSNTAVAYLMAQLNRSF